MFVVPISHAEARRLQLLSPKRRLAIACWVDDQFDTERPLALAHPPRDLDECVHWRCDPDSGVTGIVYLYRGRVLYRASTQYGFTYWDLGRLPSGL